MSAPIDRDATVVPTSPPDEPTTQPTLVGQYGLASHEGRVRARNEDRGLVLPDVGIVAVADGMGGHDDGALASAAVVDALSSVGVAVSAADLLARVEDRLIKANAALWEEYGSQGRIAGSTVALLLVYRAHYAFVWAGDSRVYLIRGGGIAQLSRDHTEARDLVERGIITSAEAEAWPRRNVITRAIGVASVPRVEFGIGEIEPGDIFVVCTDGLTGHVSDGEILSVSEGTRPQAACDALVALALERGGTDNVTVAIAGYLAEASVTAKLETIVLPGRANELDPRATP